MSPTFRCAISAGVLVIGVCAWRAPAANLRVVTWNVSNYAGGRVSEFQTAIFDVYQDRSMQPDVFIGQEFLSQAGVDAFLAMLNSAPQSPGDWQAARWVDGPDTDSAFFYRGTRVQMATELSVDGVTVVATGGTAPNHPRNIMRYDIRVDDGSANGARLAIYASHMKAGTSSTDQQRRLLEAQRIRDDAEALPADWRFLLGGDFNIQSSTQAAYIELVGSQANDDGRFFDPIDTPGSWNNNSAFRFVHSQDPAGAGGMDDRHDQILLSAGLVDGAGIDYVGDPAIPYSTTTWNDPNHSYRSWGNDGTSFNTSLTIAGNQMVGTTIAQALVTAANGAGHLPVFLDLRVPPCLGDWNCDGVINTLDYTAFPDCMSGPFDSATFVAPSDACLAGFDFDTDGDVDLPDFGTFIEFFAAP
jgi:hypothetical protein